VASATWGPLGTIVQVGEDINFANVSKNLTVDIYYNCTGSRVFNITFPSGFIVHNTGAPCGKINNTFVSCNFNNITSFNSGWYYFTAPSSIPDYTVVTLPTALSNTANCSLTNNISLLKVPNDEVFHTLVEYGRGRGNYFFSTRGGAGSGHTGTACHYLPNGTLFELNFLHKVFNVKQYFDDPDMVGLNATFTCTYPDRTIVRTHLGNAISVGANETNVTYHIDKIEGSWERMGYLGMQFDPSEQYVGQEFNITCRDIKYYLPDLMGNITVYVSGYSFHLEVRDPEPFVASASSTSTVGNGTQEVIITYSITNNELYTVDDVVIEIEAPPYAEFIGVRGELWGTALDQYRIEKMSLAPNESEIIQLVVRFDTSAAPNITALNLTSGVKVQYVTCWDLNAYNPAESLQLLQNIGSIPVNMSIPANIIGVRERISMILNITININTTVVQINNTVNNILSVVNVINSTTIDTNIIVKQINNTVNNILGNVTVALNNTNLIINDTSIIKDMLNCNGTVDTPICSGLDYINSTINNITNILIDVNNTLNNISINVTIDLSGENLSVNITPNLTNITIIIDDILAELNCSNVTSEPNGSICKRLIRIENNTILINNTATQIENLINYFNATVFGNITLQDIYDALSNITVDVSDLLIEIDHMREFDEELVFLVTDAFGLQQAAKQDVDKGDLGSAAAKLREANSRLNEATLRLVEIQRQEEEAQAADVDGGFSWVLFAIIGILAIAAVALYSIRRRNSPVQR
jgi:hypothetical protein